MAFHTNYWSCTSFADWLRGTKKLSVGTSEDWDNWRTSAKMKHNFRYWLAEEGLDYIQDFLTWPFRKLYDIKYYINNRWVTKTHALTASAKDIKPGEWCDVGNRFLPCLFNELQEYVEIELAWWHIAWNAEEAKKYKAPFWAKGVFRWRTWRCPEAGLDNLEWQRKLVWTENEVEAGSDKLGQPTHQAKNAQEILDLYHWWTKVYPNRPDPHLASGWTAVCEENRKLHGGGLGFLRTDPSLKRQSDKALKLLSKIEKDYAKEDDAMLLRLIKVRHALWT
jgi:hypothetical protein